MSIFIDPPLWPAHGTFFSHLISDTSLKELHDFAAAHEISPRAFDADHYDVPQHRYAALVSAGAQEVTGTQLTRILIRSGLRVPLKERPTKIRPRLLRAWEALAPGASAVGADLLERWEQPHRAYHNSVHLSEMLAALTLLYSPQPVPRTVLFAAWFHDAVYEAQPGQDEAASAELVRTNLMPLTRTGVLTAAEVTAAAQLVEFTASHRVPEELAGLTGGVLTRADADFFMDADLAILAAETARYGRYIAGVRTEYSHYGPQAFAQGRSGFLREFLGRDRIFASAAGHSLWDAAARTNMAAELESYT